MTLDAFQDTMSNAEEVGGDGAITQLPSDGSEFRNPLRRSGSTSSMPNYRLPTPGGALPAGRLPPISREGVTDEPGIQSIWSAFGCEMQNFGNLPYYISFLAPPPNLEVICTKTLCVNLYDLVAISDGSGEGTTNPPPPPAGINVETLQEIEIVDQDEDDDDSVSAIVSHPFR